MRQEYCGREEHVAAALAGGSPTAEILEHARECAACSEILLVATMLRRCAELSAAEIDRLPEASVVWRKVQAMAREKALERATLPIRVASIVASAAAILATPLVALQFGWNWPGANAWIRSAVGAGRFRVASEIPAALLLAATGVILCIALSSWYMLRED